MSRLDRRDRSDIDFKEGEVGLFDIFDNAVKSAWRINDEEYDYILENTKDDFQMLLIEEDLTYSEAKKVLTTVNNLLEDFKKGQ